MSGKPEIRIFPSQQELFRGAAETFSRLANEAVHARGKFSVALSGGNTPRGLHHELAGEYADKISWEKVFFFWGDERHVPPDFPESNFRMAKETLLSKLPIPADHVFRIAGELPDAEQAALLYQNTLLDQFRPALDEFPRFDLMLQGIGGDGHTASLFPGTKALEEQKRFVVGNWVEQHSTWRITVTYPVINNAANVMFLVDGSGKAEIVKKALQESSARLPCQGVLPRNGNLMWYLDQAAGSKL